MAIQLGAALRNDMISRYEAFIGVTPKLYFYTGVPPASCAAADTGVSLGILTLPSDWMASGTSGTVAINNGPWTGAGIASGTAGYYRLKDSAGTTVHEQGTVGTTSQDLVLDNAAVVSGQAISIITWTRIQGGE